MYTLTAKASDNLGAKTVSQPVDVVVDQGVSTSERHRALTIRVAPNPTVGSFRFLTDEMLSGATLRVYNADNQLVLAQVLQNNDADMGALPSGAYFLEIETEGRARLRATVVKQ